MKVEEVKTVAGAFEDIAKAYHVLALICKKVAEGSEEKKDVESMAEPKVPVAEKDVEKATEKDAVNDVKLEKNTEAPKPEKTVALTDIRAVLANKSQDGKRKEVKDLLTKYGAGRLSEVKPEDYASILKDAEVL